MLVDIEIRTFEAGDIAALKHLYPAAFPEEDLLPLVNELSVDEDVVAAWVATIMGGVVGHVAFTQCAVGNSFAFYLLGPLAVKAQFQRQGVGKKLIETGVNALRERGATHVYVLGDPAYYGRSGFRAETSVTPPFELPVEWDGAWQSIALSMNVPAPEGKLLVPLVWDKRELWAP